MKKILFALIAVAAIGLFCSFQLPSAKADEARTFIGTIKSFRPVMGRPSKWYCARFTAVADNGEKKEIWILGASGAAPTSVTNFDGKPVDKLGYNHRPQVGKKVEVKYTIAENGRNDAVSIRYVTADYVPAPAAPAGSQAADVPSEPKNLITGRINEVWPGVPRSLKVKDCKIRVIPDSGKDAYFETKDALISDTNGTALACDSSNLKNERVEVIYSEADGSIYDPYKPAKAVAIHYLAGNSVSSPTSSTTAAPAAANNIFVGKVVKGGITFNPRCPYWFVIMTDNGEKKDLWIPRDNMRVTGLNGSQVYGAPPREGKKIEVQYSVGDHGQYETVSMRYVPENYVSQPGAAPAKKIERR